MERSGRALVVVSLAVAAACARTLPAHAATPVVVINEAGFEGLEEPSILYFPDTDTFQTDPINFKNHVDEGGSLFRDTLRNEYPSPVAPYAPGPGWWDGDGADNTRTDRQRSEPKGIVGLGHQQVEQTFEYSFDFRTDPTFTATSNFCHIFQLKATNGDDGSPLATISLYKNGSAIQGRVDCFTDGTTGNNTEIIPTTFSYTAGQWSHFVIRITPCAQGETTGQIQLSVNGGAFKGVTNSAVDLTGSTDFRPKFGFYRGISTTNGVPIGDSWVEHRTITGYTGASNVLTWQGGQNNNTWDHNTTANFLNGASNSVFNTIDQVNFTGTTNTTINLAGSLWPNFADVNSTANYTFQGAGAITGGTLRKDGSGTLTLATTNSYTGLTDVRAGTLLVTGSIGNNSLASITGGTLKAGSTTALGSNSTIGTEINGGTLDINGFNLSTEPITAQGAGVGGAGAIINTGAAQTSALNNVTLSSDTTIGGTGRWDIRGGSAMLSTSGNGYNLTKTGSNQISLVGTSVDSALGDIAVNQGILAFQTSTTSMGDPSQTLTIASGATVSFFNTAAAMSKIATLNGGTMWAESGTGTQNTFAGPITLGAAGGIFDAGSALTGGAANASALLNITGIIGGAGALTKNGPGTVTLSAVNTYTGATTVNAGTVALPAAAAINSSTITVNSGSTFNVNGSLKTTAAVTVNGTANFSADTRTLATLSVGSGGLAAVASSASPFSPAVLQLSTLGFTNNTSKLNLTNNELVANGSSTIALGLITNGNVYTTDTTPNIALGYIDVAGGKMEIRFTLKGDTDLNGSVDVADLGALASNYGAAPGSGKTWAQGDFNRDGGVDVSDLGALATTYGSALAGGPAASPTELIAAATAVPEPSTVMMVLPTMLLAQRRRRR
ncbi:MAG TPA: autotransporter-associated beta strand repeat-containing protein [Tepidisphaeraceae bacterium]|nr:autotransporter-associated beta strand repeat-containing protein [Tepidisphaeraceae bacterium]